jgi:signal transduction histidine kinase
MNKANDEKILESIAHLAEESLLKANNFELNEYLKILKKTNPTILYAYIVDNSNQIIAHTTYEYISKSLNKQIYNNSLNNTFSNYNFEITDSLKQQNDLFKNYEASTKIKQMTFFYTKKGEHILTVRVGFFSNFVDKKIKSTTLGITYKILKINFFIFCIGLLLLWIITYNLDSYISVFFKALTLLGEGKFDTRIKIESKDELGRLAIEFNKMAEKLKEIDYLKEDFVSNVTHELRSPLGAIESYLNYMIDEDEKYEINKREDLFFRDINLHERYQYLLRMRNNTRRLREFINNLLDISKIESGNVKLDKKMVNIKNLIEDVKNLFFMQAKDKNIDIECRIDDLIDCIYIDEERIKQLLTNLVNNAIKFNTFGGKIMIEVSPVFNGAKKIKESIHSIKIAVSDTGIGIPEEYINKIFNKFEQVKHNDMSQKEKGTGLGLSVAKGIVEAHSGKIWVDTVFGKGSTFYVEIPAIILE